eukprot:3086717-Karenia_brevis.AAC.1
MMMTMMMTMIIIIIIISVIIIAIIIIISMMVIQNAEIERCAQLKLKILPRINRLNPLRQTTTLSCCQCYWNQWCLN